MNMYKLFMASFVWAMTSVCALAQHNYFGLVFDAQTKEPLPGVTLGFPSGKGLITDATGRFSLVGNPTRITVSAVGYRRQEVVLIPSRPVRIALEPAVEDLQTVVVTGNREAALRTETPIAISKLSARLINETKPTSIYEVINKTPGVLMVNLNNEQHMMAIRQPMTTNAYFLYLEDGVPVRPMGVFNHNALLEMNQFTVSSIEVVKGPVSSMYGPEAVGGAVNFITQRPTAVPTARAGIQIDQWGYQRVQVGAGARQGKFGLYVGGLLSRQRDSWLASSNYDKSSYFARLEYAFSPNTRLTGTVSYNDYNSQTSGSVDSTAFFARQYVSTTDFTYRKTVSFRSRLTLEHTWKNGSESFVTGFARKNSVGQNPAYSIRWTTGSPTATGQINSNDFSSYGVIAQHTQKLSFLNSKLIVGTTLDLSPNTYYAYQTELTTELRADKKSVVKYTQVRERPDNQLANYSAHIHNVAAYGQYDLEPLPKLRVSAGLRYDRMAFDYTNALDRSSGGKAYGQVTPKLGATYDLGGGKGLYANVSKGFSPPALTSIFLKRTTPTATSELFYYNLNPARFNNVEIGGWASLLGNKLYIDGALYQMTGTNELLNIRQPDNSTDYQSAGRTLHRGVELGVTYRPSKQVFFRFGGTHAVHRFVEFTLSQRVSDAVQNVNGNDMPSAPRTLWNTEVSYYPVWLKNFRTSVEWQHVAGWYQNQINTVRYGGYDVANVRAGYEWKGIELFTNVMNVTNALFATNATRGNNATDRTTYTPAAPRTVVVGVQYTFSGK
ncbi:TonB-dependent receptor [Spirosoma fluviale]|uniref:Outer membrane receptor proteins, mostly Fe transport n=1 Tax=Spirosoma fluviale TaxID=1597977 RepID=A0A286G2C2_9BACT|nr:TonB-dependent receptor [Spirosoma fluviale]SOD89396.1 Outer membrane receptor proteins, mostly Fe transport [Spirosoma fluviale]